MRLGKWHRRLVLVTLILVAASGVLWFVLHDVMEWEPDQILHALLVMHGVTAFGAAIAFGSLLPLHVPVGCRQRRNLVTGICLATVMAVLIASALLLYYGAEQTREWARLVHLWVGFFALVAFPFHIAVGRRRAARGTYFSPE
jgi:hypothetical protein